MNLQLRLATQDDYPQLMELLQQLHTNDPLPDRLGEQAFAEILASDYFHLIVAAEGAKLVGTCYLNIIPNLSRGGRPYALIENVITDAEHRGKGVGKAMMQHALELARQAGCYKLMLMTGRQEQVVHDFYRKLGFSGDRKQAYVQYLGSVAETEQ